jgi:hypothetical protein
MNAHTGRQIFTKEGLLQAMVDELSIPTGYDEKARSRYGSIGDWLNRPASSIKEFGPKISSQGSFALGTVIRPIGDGDAYDVDIVCELTKADQFSMSQADLKEKIGFEIKAYSKANNMNSSPADSRRCWTLTYADDASFHMDILPSIPGQDHYLRKVASFNGAIAASERLSSTAIGITDKKDPGYNTLGAPYLISNPKGYVRWFRERQSTILEKRRAEMKANGRFYASVEEFPNHEVRTPLQDSIKLLKRHRDGMFEGDKHKPISIIISTLAAEAYSGEQTISDTLRAILPKMQQRVEELGSIAVISNPSYPLENFADKWVEVPAKRQNFEEWVDRARRDFQTYLVGSRFNEVTGSFRKNMTETTVRKVEPQFGLAAAMIATGAAAAAAEVAKVSASGEETRPWFPGE